MIKIIKKRIEKVIKLLKWISFLRRDEEYDYIFLFKIIRFKLDEMYSFFSNPSRSYLDPKDSLSIKAIKSLRICRDLLDFLIEVDYELGNNYKKFSENNKILNDNIFDKEEYFIDGKKLYKVKLVESIYSNDKKENERLIVLRKRCIEIDNKIWRKRSKLLFRIFEKNYLNWWS